MKSKTNHSFAFYRRKTIIMKDKVIIMNDIFSFKTDENFLSKNITRCSLAPKETKLSSF